MTEQEAAELPIFKIPENINSYEELSADKFRTVTVGGDHFNRNYIWEYFFQTDENIEKIIGEESKYWYCIQIPDPHYIGLRSEDAKEAQMKINEKDYRELCYRAHPQYRPGFYGEEVEAKIRENIQKASQT